MGVSFVVLREADVARGVCKRLSLRARGDVEARRQMAREAEVLRALDGRGAPRLVDAGEDAHGPFVVAEQLALESLTTRFGVDTRPTADWLARASRASLRALECVHHAGFFHGDLSPSNL